MLAGRVAANEDAPIGLGQRRRQRMKRSLDIESIQIGRRMRQLMLLPYLRFIFRMRRHLLCKLFLFGIGKLQLFQSPRVSARALSAPP